MSSVDELYQASREAYQQGDDNKGDRLEAEAKRLEISLSALMMRQWRRGE